MVDCNQCTNKDTHCHVCAILHNQYSYIYYSNQIGGQEQHRDYYGTPTKCFKCGSKNMLDMKHLVHEHMLIEYEVECGDCGEFLGRWAYGTWSY